MAIRDTLRRHPKAVRRGLSLMAALVMAYASSWIPQVGVWWRFRVRGDAVLWKVPTRLELPVVDASRFVEVSKDGWTFSIPWQRPTATYRRTSRRRGVEWRVLEFAERRQVRLNIASTECLDPRAFWECSANEERMRFCRAIFGERGAASAWAAVDVTVQTTPRQLRPWMDMRESIRTMMVLQQKDWFLLEDAPDVQSFETVHGGGLVFRRHAEGRPIRVTVFATGDRCVDMQLKANDGSPAFTQDELNTILATIRHTAEPATLTATEGSR